MLGQRLKNGRPRGLSSGAGHVGDTSTVGHFSENNVSNTATTVKQESQNTSLSLVTTSVTTTLHRRDNYPVQERLVCALIEQELHALGVASFSSQV